LAISIYILAFTRYCFTSSLYCTIIFFANTPFIVQYIAQYYQLSHPAPNFEVFLRCLLVFFCFLGSDFGWVEVYKSFSTRKRGHYCTLLCNTPLPAPLYCLQYCAIYFPHDPLYCNKILAIYLVRANIYPVFEAVGYSREIQQQDTAGWTIQLDTYTVTAEYI